MKKVLLCLPSLSRTNGIAKFVFSYYDFLVKNGIKIDFLLAFNQIDEKYKEILEKNENKIFIIEKGNKLNRIRKTKKTIKKVLKENKYDIVHVNLVDQYAYGCIKGAEEENVKKIIYHVHNPYTIGKLLFVRDILNSLCIKKSNELVACTNHAGKSMFKNKKFKVIKNALDFDDYQFKEEYRKKYRKEFNVEDKLVVGVSARICDQKNPYKILNIFNELFKKNNNSVLVWAGSGEMENKLKSKITKMGLDKNVVFLGNRNDINMIYSCFDLFLLPSKYEGLGIVFLEAQSTGLQVYTSDKIPEDVFKTDLIQSISLKTKSEKWAKIILDNTNKKVEREKYYEVMKKTDYNIESCCNEILDLYKK